MSSYELEVFLLHYMCLTMYSCCAHHLPSQIYFCRLKISCIMQLRKWWELWRVMIMKQKMRKKIKRVLSPFGAWRPYFIVYLFTIKVLLVHISCTNHQCQENMFIVFTCYWHCNRIASHHSSCDFKLWGFFLEMENSKQYTAVMYYSVNEIFKMSKI